MGQLASAGAGGDPRDELELELEVHNDLAHEKLAHVQLRLALEIAQTAPYYDSLNRWVSIQRLMLLRDFFKLLRQLDEVGDGFFECDAAQLGQIRRQDLAQHLEELVRLHNSHSLLTAILFTDNIFFFTFVVLSPQHLETFLGGAEQLLNVKVYLLFCRQELDSSRSGVIQVLEQLMIEK